MVLLLTRTDIETVLPMAECIASQEHAFREHGLGTAQTPHRLGLQVPDQDGLYVAMPSYLGQIPAANQGRTGAMAVKVLTFYPGNPASGRPAIVATVLLHDPHTGELLAIMDGASITGLRTAAGSAVATTVEGADIVVTATTAREPIVDGDWFAPGVHINCVGSGIPDRRELDDKIVQRAKIVVDTHASALEEAGDLLIPMAKGLLTKEAIHADLGEILTGQKVGRTDKKEITIFKSVGVALQDVAAAAWAYRRARELGLGQVVEF
ncbi:MAG: hypothetical protein HYR94_18020 [Chloroflexi bacterium]|nr:hypothetical protein [Chloroflexota bacterium]